MPGARDVIGTVKIRTRLRTHGREIRKDIDANGKAALARAGEYVVEQMRVATPRLTGRARGSITWQMQDRGSEVQSPAISRDKIPPPRNPNEVAIGSALWRMKFLEFGTARTRAYDNIRGPFIKARTPIRRFFSQAYNVVLGRRG